ncbi:MAG: DUF1800 family protein [Gammaproteobacteria bacterium]|nr:DUF1800 family protein [Gammaproteobacteria bacterium]
MKNRNVLVGAVLVFLLGGCGSNDDVSDSTTDDSSSGDETSKLPPPTEQEAARFLQHATYGPNETEIGALTHSSYNAWLANQFSQPLSSHVAYLDKERPAYLAQSLDVTSGQSLESFWAQAATAPDALRQRVAFALLDFFVVSFQNSALADNPYALSSFHDMLAGDAFGNYRQLLEDVTLHPTMGIYLSHLANQKETTRTVNGQTVVQLPDENYAREVMQLFSIGLWELNADGTQKRDSSGNPIPTYGQDDILGMAKVMTGFSWGQCANSNNDCFRGALNSADTTKSFWRVPMQAFDRFHSTAEKHIIAGRIIPAGGTAQADLDIALDALFNHPNAGPFFGKQLIQRLVTSNPSPAYVQRVASAFNNNGNNVRGDMKAVIRAVLLDPEALDLRKINDPKFGKLREPVVKYGQLLRAFTVRAPSGYFRTGNLMDSFQGIGQMPYFAPSVFNSFRPDYAPTGNILNAGLAAPEFQITTEVTVTSTARAFDNLTHRVADGRADTLVPDYTAFVVDASSNPERLVDRLNLLLTANTLSASTRTTLINMLKTMPSTTDKDKLDRVRHTAWVISMSPDFAVQK